MSLKGIKLRVLSLFLLTTLCFSLFSNISVEAVELLSEEALSEQTITIFHTNDIHGHSGSQYSNGFLTNIGSDYLKSVKDATPNSILVDAGDNVQGTAFAGIKKGAYSIEMMNMAGYDVATLGNHEFDYGYDQILENIKNANFPYIAANVLNDGNPLTQRDDDIIKNNGCNIVKEVAGKKIGFFGITTTETAAKSVAEDVISFEDEIKVSKEQVEDLKSQGVDLIIAIMHVGCDAASDPNSHDIAENVDGIDVIIDGHSHTVETKNINDTVIQQTGCYGKNLGRIDITFSKTGEANITASNVSAKEIGQNYTPNQKVREHYNNLSKDIEYLSKVVAKVGTPLFGGYYNDLAIARISETNLGDIAADAILEKVKELNPDLKSNDKNIVSLINGGAVRSTISSGYVCLNDVYNVFPYDNTLVGLEISEKDLFEVLESSVSSVKLPKNPGEGLSGIEGKFPQISGMRFEFNPKNEVGSRVQKVTIVDEQGNDKKELDRNDSYSKLIFLTNDYIASGKDGYDILKSYPPIYENKEQKMKDVLESYLIQLTYENNGEISYPFNQNRIDMIKPAELFPNFNAKLTLLGDDGKALVNENVNIVCDDKDLGEFDTNENGELIIENLETGSHLITVIYNDIKVYGMVSDNFISDDTDSRNLTLQVFHDYDYDVECVSNIISQIPELSELTENDGNLVEFARSSYDSLREDLKSRVSDYSRLVEAESKFNNNSGWKSIDGNWYYFENGVMVTNRWIFTNNLWYYLGEDGVMLINNWVQNWDGKWYYMDLDGAMLTNDWVQNWDGKWYYLGEDGAMVINRWIFTNGLWYYLGEDGAMAINLWIDNYYVDNNGVWINTR